MTGIDEGADFIRVIVPSNAIGYDTYVWTQYFAVIEASATVSARRARCISFTASMRCPKR